jgi:cyclomaltodextrinase / maltogenic alpha-amylase / neopullulanase
MKTLSKKLLFLTLLFITVLFTSCRLMPPGQFGDGGDIFGLASPVRLGSDTTTIFLSDYFLSPSLPQIDSIRAHPDLQLNLSSDKKELKVFTRSRRNIPYVSEMKIWLGETAYSLIIERSQRERFTFRFDPQGERYSNVAIRGEMNDWNARRNPLNLIDGIWQAQLDLNPGRYQYLIVTNGRDMLDPNNPVIADNNIGGFNSVLEVGNVDKSLVPHLTPLSTRRNTITIGLINQAEEVLVFWENFRLPEENLNFLDQQLQVQIPGDARSRQRSHLRIRTYNRHGPGNDLLIPLEFGKPVMDSRLLNEQDKEATILYFMMVDRFYNGNEANDHPVDDPEVADRANYLGGDLAGIIKKVKEGYFKSLGINTIWMSPITQNPAEAFVEFPEPRRKYTGYHGYWPITLTTVDHRFGTSEEMHELVRVARENDISVMLDFVSNHVHEDNPLIQQNPGWATTLDLPDGRKNIRLWDEYRLTTWFDTFLPSLDFSIPEVIETMSDSAFFWIHEYGLDGFRHDATKHVNLPFWRTLTKKLKEDYMVPNNQRLFQIGETFGSRELIGSYVGSGLLDGQFDFNLYFDARSVFAIDAETFHKLNYSLSQSFSYYGYNNLMGNITGNHDLPRFISLAGGDLSFSEDEKEAGWERTVGVGDPSGYKKLSQLSAFIMTIPGVPVVYYGDEIGLPGASDPDSRRLMKFEGLSQEEQWTRDRLSQLSALRNNNMALIYGDFRTLHLSEQVYVYARNYFNHKAIVFLNKSPDTKQIRVELPAHLVPLRPQGHFGSVFSYDGHTLEVEVSGYGYEIITGSNK